MQSRRSLRLLAGALVLTVPLLGSCGFGKATDKIYTPGEGTNNRDGDVKILSAVVVSAQPDSGTFIATLSNNTPDLDEITFDSLAGAGEWQDLEIADVDPAVEIAPRDFANLADGDGVAVSGEFEPGEMMSLTLTFGNGETQTMNVPVVYACDEYTGLDTSVSEASTEPEASESPSPGEVPTESASPTAEPATGADTYDCAAVFEE